MTSFYDTLNNSYLGYAAVFLCIGVAFLFLRRAASGEIGPGYWSASFFFGGAGFLFWSGLVPLVPGLFFLIGEMLHVLGFFMLVCGAYRFSGNGYKPWNLFVVGGWVLVWVVSIFLLRGYPYLRGFLLKTLRIALFLGAGLMILEGPLPKSLAGRRLSGWSLVAWGLYSLIFVFWQLPSTPASTNLAFGFLAGFQILSSLGMVIMIIDRIRIRAKDSEIKVKRLEGFLPICSFCKRIRDENNSWHTIEKYIMERSDTEFHHIVCPDCAKTHYPDFDAKADKEKSS
jgi:hypothetical protein